MHTSVEFAAASILAVGAALFVYRNRPLGAHFVLQLLSLVPLVAGIAATIYLEVFERYIEKVAPDRMRELETAFTLGLVATIAVSVGIERYTHFHSVESKIDELRKLVASSVTARSITGQEEIYTSAARLAESASTSIKLLVHANSPPAPDFYGMRLAQHLERNRAVIINVVFVVDISSITDEQWAAQERRFAMYRHLGVDKQVKRFFVDSKRPIGFDLIIVDEKHVGLGFSPVIGQLERNKEYVIHFENQPIIAAPLRAWFDNTFLLSRIIQPYEKVYAESIRRRQRENGPRPPTFIEVGSLTLRKITPTC